MNNAAYALWLKISLVTLVDSGFYCSATLQLTTWRAMFPIPFCPSLNRFLQRTNKMNAMGQLPSKVAYIIQSTNQLYVSTFCLDFAYPPTGTQYNLYTINKTVMPTACTPPFNQKQTQWGNSRPRAAPCTATKAVIFARWRFCMCL